MRGLRRHQSQLLLQFGSRRTESGEDRRLDERPGVHHERVVEPQSLEACRRGGRVSQEVLVAEGRAVVVEAPVHLQDDPAREDEIDAADAIDPHLAVEADAEFAEPQSQQ